MNGMKKVISNNIQSFWVNIKTLFQAKNCSTSKQIVFPRNLCHQNFLLIKSFFKTLFTQNMIRKPKKAKSLKP